MDWNLLGLTFMAVFLAEIGDKSHLAAIALGSSTQHPKAVFAGTAAALLLTSFLGVWLGSGAAQLLPTAWVKIAAAIGFAILGVRLLWGAQGQTLRPGCQSRLQVRLQPMRAIAARVNREMRG